MAIYVGARIRSVTIEPDWDDGPDRYADIQVEWPLDQFTEQVAGEAADSTAAADLNGETVTVAEIDAWIKQQLFDQATKQGDPMKLYELRSGGLDDFINERLLEKEAAPLGLTPEELVDQEAKKQTSVPDEEVLAFYEENKERMGEVAFEDVEPRIRQHLEQQRGQAAAQEYMEGIRANASVNQNDYLGLSAADLWKHLTGQQIPEAHGFTLMRGEVSAWRFV